MTALILAALTAPTADAWSLVRLEDGRSLRWTDDNPWVDAPYLPLAANTRNSAGVTPDVLQASVVRGLQRWQAASLDAFEYDYWQGDDSEVFSPCLEQDGLSAIFFASANPEAVAWLNGRTAAYTQIWYDEATGHITEVDIVLNDLYFGFTDDPLAASYGSGGQLGQVLYLDDVITHELGHALGIGHSGVLSSTMFTWSWADQSALSCDDRGAVGEIFGNNAEVGRITGAVVGPDGAPVFGAQVTAVSRDRAASVTATFTEANGSFLLEGLQPGEWYLMVEPFHDDTANLSEFYAGVDHDLCGGERFARTFLLGGDGVMLEPLEVGVTSAVLAPTLEVRCEAPQGTGAGPAQASAATLAEGSLHFNVAEVVAMGAEDAWYLLRDVEGAFSLEILSYSLFSPAWIRPKVVDIYGDEVPGAVVDEPRFSDADSGYDVWDSRLTVTLPERGDYYLILEANRLSEDAYPGGETYLEEDAFALLIGSPEVSGEGYDCGTEEVFTEYTSPEGEPLRREVDDGVAGADAGVSRGCSMAPVGLAGWWALVLAGLTRRRRSPGRVG